MKLSVLINLVATAIASSRERVLLRNTSLINLIQGSIIRGAKAVPRQLRLDRIA
jgi:hypothetical protein